MLAQRRSVWSARSRSHRRYGRQPCRIGAVQRIFGRRLCPVSCRSDREPRGRRRCNSWPWRSGRGAGGPARC